MTRLEDVRYVTTIRLLKWLLQTLKREGCEHRKFVISIFGRYRLVESQVLQVSFSIAAQLDFKCWLHSSRCRKWQCINEENFNVVYAARMAVYYVLTLIKKICVIVYNKPRARNIYASDYGENVKS